MFTTVHCLSRLVHINCRLKQHTGSLAHQVTTPLTLFVTQTASFNASRSREKGCPAGRGQHIPIAGESNSMGTLAGTRAVHRVGGISGNTALCGAYFIGPRKGRCGPESRLECWSLCNAGRHGHHGAVATTVSRCRTHIVAWIACYIVSGEDYMAILVTKICSR